jgi:hypothetical protein
LATCGELVIRLLLCKKIVGPIANRPQDAILPTNESVPLRLGCAVTSPNRLRLVMYVPYLVFPYQRSPSRWYTLVSVFTQTFPDPEGGGVVGRVGSARLTESVVVGRPAAGTFAGLLTTTIERR